MNNSKDKCILFFIKYPEKGTVKQRLSPWLSDEVIVALYRQFVRDVFSTLQTIDSAMLICVSPEEKIDECCQWLGAEYIYIPQIGDTLGERMKNCFYHAFSHGFHRVILLGSDCPDLPQLYISAAFRSLEEYSGVIGPSIDGGYYLIGFSETVFTPEVFRGISWSTDKVFMETVQHCKNAAIPLALLPEWSDIDTLTDLQEFIQRNSHRAPESSYTLSYLKQHPQIVTQILTPHIPTLKQKH